MKMCNKDEVYVLNNPKHIISTIVIVDFEFPVNEKIHNSLCTLSDNTDVIFVFSDKLCNNSKDIFKEKFTTLYNGCAYIDSNLSISRSIVKIFLYCKEIFNRHLGYLVARGSDLLSIDSSYINKLLKITESDIVKPVFHLRRLSGEELFEYYSIDKCCGDNILIPNPFNLINLINVLLSPKLLNTISEYNDKIDCRYCSWTSDSSAMFFKNGVVNQILKQLGGEISYEYIDTFTSSDPRYFLSNLIKLLGIDNLNYNIEDIDF